MAKDDWRQVARGVLRQDSTGLLGVLEVATTGIGRQVRFLVCAEKGCLAGASVVRNDGQHRCRRHA